MAESFLPRRYPHRIESSFTSVDRAARLFTLMRLSEMLKTQSSMMMLRLTSLVALVHQFEQPMS